METLDLQDLILDKLNTLIVVLNNKGDIEFVSRSAQSILGYKPNDLLGDNWWEATRFSKPEGAQVKTKLMDLFKNRSNTVHQFEHLLKTSYGNQKWFSWNVSYLSDTQLVGIGMDITEKKHKERELLEKNNRLHEQHKEITDSIRYAKRIQQNILQSPDYISKIMKQHFVYYKPKDIISGDFYFFHEDEFNKYVIAVDCTGHGVPGAMMSMVANSIIKEVLLNKKIRSPAEILYEMDKELFTGINSYNSEISNDGMDAAVVCLNKKTGRLHYAGAFRSLIIVRNQNVIELKANRYPLGFYSDIDKVFEEQVIMLQPNDQFFVFSDGYADQFGGEENRKFNKRNFKELLKTIADMPLDEQEGFLDYALNNWKQDNEQTDDVLVIGIKV
jgi:PAS domain S-box-containing protein